MAAAFLMGLWSCTHETRVLVIEKETQLLQQPFPPGYPSSAPIPNSVIRLLEPQNVTILSDSFHKDFHVYKVRDSLGNEGYVIGRAGVTVEQH
jgi:hypothetical protein